MTVYFANAGLIDLDVIRIMGVSVKKSKTPIGYFGTGLKFSIATLLRTGHEVCLFRGGEKYRFEARDAIVRGETVKRIFMNNEALPFTTSLGRNWEVWQAYRELHSNTLDEAGTISDDPQSADTIFAVTGDAIQREYINRASIFLEGKPISGNEFVEVYPGTTRNVYYRGVRAGTMPNEMRFTYNILTDMTLTEDRTFESQFSVEWKLCQLLPKLNHKGIHTELLNGSEAWDQSLDFSMCGSPSQEFLDVAKDCYSDMTSNAAAKKVVDRDMQQRGDFAPAKMLDQDHEKFLSAFQHLHTLGCSLSPEDVEIVESLGPSIMAMYHRERGQIFLTKSTLDWGMETVVAALYEEWLHKEYHYRDKTTELQNFLFQRLVALSMGAEPPQPEAQKMVARVQPLTTRYHSRGRNG